jgi:F-type H+-transporting ATPase subunit a
MTIPPLAAEIMFHIGNFPITNSYINSTILLVFFVCLAFFIQRFAFNKKNEESVPRGLYNFFESIVEIILDYMDKVTHSRVRSIKFLPIVGTLFLFILISNWMGILPGIGSIGIWQEHHGSVELVPLFRPANADLNLTLAMAVVAVFASHILGIFAVGFFTYANKFIKLGDLWHAVRSFDAVKMMTAVIEFFVGLIEVVSEVAKVLSLSLRLFGNIFAGEVLLTVMAALFAFFLPLPFMFLEILVGLIQAVVFSMLTLAYLSLATTEIRSHADHDTDDIEPTPAF